MALQEGEGEGKRARERERGRGRGRRWEDRKEEGRCRMMPEGRGKNNEEKK